ncbi:hypothetical protein BLOT_009325 [Blomia tropicalis]|nr:hypothetical protein BLOT_009325 [Blomia tropicalis]
MSPLVLLFRKPLSRANSQKSARKTEHIHKCCTHFNKCFDTIISPFFKVLLIPFNPHYIFFIHIDQSGSTEILIHRIKYLLYLHILKFLQIICDVTLVKSVG